MADWSSYTSQTGSKSVAPGQIAYEGVGGDQDSLTQFLRSLFNANAQTGQQALTSGIGATNTALDYWRQILSGNPAAIAQVLSPELQATAAQYQQARHAVDTFAPRGGGRASIMTQLPFQQAATTSNLIAQARPMAAGNLAQTGLNLGGLGGSLLDAVMQGQLNRRQQNATTDAQNRSLLTSGLSSILSAPLSGLTGFGLGNMVGLGGKSAASSTGGSGWRPMLPGDY